MGEVDVLIDLFYLIYGFFVFMGVDLKFFFDIVYEVNMGKIFLDGKVYFDFVIYKILKLDDWEEYFVFELLI